MSKGVKAMRLFGGERAPRVVSAETGREDAPEYVLSDKSRRLTHLPAWMREMVPWLAGSVETCDRIGSLKQQVRTYRLMAAGLAMGMVVLAVALVWLSSEVADARVVPYVVQVDEHGFTVPIGAMERAAPLDARVVMASLARWVSALRTVTGDAHSQEALIGEAFSFAGQKSVAATKMNEWYRQHPPFDGTGRHVEVQIARVAPLPSGTDFSVEWTETATDAAGEHPEQSLYSAVVSVRISPTQKLKDIITNPLGVFVKDFSISKLQ